MLAMAIARYEHGALAETYQRHAGAVYSLAHRLLIEQSLAEDVVQEIFLRLWNDPTRFDWSRGTMRSYLLTQTHARSVDLLRSNTARRAREQRQARATANSGYDLELEVWDLATSDQVRRSLEALPAAERRAINLAYFGGYTYREVAELLGEAEGTVKTRIRAGLRRLRSALRETGLTTEDH